MPPLEPIGYVRGGPSEPTEDPGGLVAARVELRRQPFTPKAARRPRGVFAFADPPPFPSRPGEQIESRSRHLRGCKDWPGVGIFFQRGKDRRNRLAGTSCAIRGVEGLIVRVQGLGALDGSPILNIQALLDGFRPAPRSRRTPVAQKLMDCHG